MKKLFKRVALMVMASLTLSVGTSTIDEVKAASETKTYTFSSFTEGTQYAENEEHVLDEEYGLKITTTQCYFTTQLRIYSSSSHDGFAVLSSETNIVGLSFNAGNKVDTLNVYGSSDNSSWNLIEGVSINSTSYKDYDVTDFSSTPYSYIKLDVAGSSQVRLKSISVSYYVDDSAPSLSISGDSNVEVGNTISLIESHNNIEGTVTWTSSDETVATVDNNGVVTACKMGTTTITAKIGEVEATKDITVYPVAGSEISIADALKVCELTGSNEAPYTYSTTGTIESIDTASIDTAYDENYGNITVTITDGNNSIQAYRMTGGSDLYEGAKIKVTGKLTTYNSTPEFVAGCTYELFESDEISSVLESLNKINSYMSLSYQYKETTTIEYNIVDVLNQDVTQVTGTSYTDWSNKTLNSSAIYAGQCAGSNQSIQLRSSNSNSGVITTASGGKVKKITVEWNSNTASERTLNVYGNNTAYSSPTDLYDESTDGELLGTIVNGESTELTITGDYQYIGFRSASGAMYLTSVSVEWETTEGHEVKTMSDSKFLIRCGIDSSIAEIEGVDTFGVKISAGSNTVYYSDSLTSTSDNGIDFTYVVIDLGNIINDNVKLSTKFTVEAYVEVDSTKYVSELSKEYSVADMVNEYHTNGSDEVKTKVNHLYEYFVKQGLIVEEAN